MPRLFDVLLEVMSNFFKTSIETNIAIVVRRAHIFVMCLSSI
jgi:hypothetical protein